MNRHPAPACDIQAAAPNALSGGGFVGWGVPTRASVSLACFYPASGIFSRENIETDSTIAPPEAIETLFGKAGAGPSACVNTLTAWGAPCLRPLFGCMGSPPGTPPPTLARPALPG
ncbi:MAG: hypothetical protein D6765_03715 [Bacteroidetes bacterium]|nr:MAG: hypothetical protein D6765_03715 [Bacteroidota bacterium]